MTRTLKLTFTSSFPLLSKGNAVTLDSRMPVHFFASAVSNAVPTEYWASIAASFVAISFLKTWSKGTKLLDPPPPPRSSSSNSPPPPPPDALFNDLHGRVILVACGAFTPLGVVTLSSLAHRGAQIIALTPDISSPDVIQIIHLIRDSTQSELIYAEQCDVGSLESVSAFAALWNAGDKKQQEGVRRLDALLFLPPAREQLDRVQLVGAQQYQGKTRRCDAIYQLHVLSRFHLVNSLLSSLLVLPPDREIRIVSVLSPFYAAGLNHFDILPTAAGASPEPSSKAKGKGKSSPSMSSSAATLKSLSESSYSALIGAASLRWHALTIELQRRVDLLAEADPRPRTKLPGIDVQQASAQASGTTGSATAQEKASQRMRQHSNISIVNVCPGFERNTDIIETFFPAPSPSKSSPPTRPESASKQNGTNKSKAATILEHELDQRDTSPSSGFDLLFTIRLVLRFILLILIWPIVWLLSKSPATAAESLVWATTRKLESHAARYQRILSSLTPQPKPDPKKWEEKELRRWEDDLVPGEIYREGRIVRPKLPERFSAGGGVAWEQLWKEEEEEVERRVKALGGSIKRPKM